MSLLLRLRTQVAHDGHAAPSSFAQKRATQALQDGALYILDAGPGVTDRDIAERSRRVQMKAGVAEVRPAPGPRTLRDTGS